MTDREQLEQILSEMKGNLLPVWLSSQAIEMIADNILKKGLTFNPKLVIQKGEDRAGANPESYEFEWVPASEALPAVEMFVIAIVSGKPRFNITCTDAPCIATYHHADDRWVIEEYPLWRKPRVKYWAYIPDMPKRSGDA